MTTYGFELEFEQGAAEVTRHLYNNHREMIGSPTLHSYHCDCKTCTINPECSDCDCDHEGCTDDIDVYHLRAQNDSSCSGEIISAVLGNIEVGRELFEAIQEAAWEVDAEPGLNSGMHVHVGMGRWNDLLSRDARNEQAEAFFQWLRWEEVFTKIAQGRFNCIRPFNVSMRERLKYTLERGYFFGSNRSIIDHGMEFQHAGFDYWFEKVAELPNRSEVIRNVFENSREQDRHSYLATNTRHGTWEFRIWNSTRVAWRMELFTELSRMLVDPAFVKDLAEATPPTNVTATTVGEVLYDMIPNPIVAELLERQLNLLGQIEHEEIAYSPLFTAV